MKPQRHSLVRCLSQALALLIGALTIAAGHCEDAAPDAGNLSEQDLAVPTEQRLWLDGDTHQDLAFYLPERSGKAHGGVLIIPNRGEHPAVRGLIDSLRHSLADNHWHTLALNITDQDDDAVQNAVAEGIAALNARGIFNIALLGEGTGALYALRYIAALPPSKQGEIGQIRALIMINAARSGGDAGESPVESLGSVTLPVLDAWFANDLDQQTRSRLRRSAAATAGGFYQQARLPYTRFQSDQSETRITKRVRGWLDKNVAGFMVDSTDSSGSTPER